MKLKFVYDFPRPSVTATIGLFVQSTSNNNASHVVLGRRGRKDGAYSGYLCLPGGFLDAKVDEKDVFAVVAGKFFSLVEYCLNKVLEPIHTMLGNEDREWIKAQTKPGETVEETAIREVFEETGLTITKDRLQLAHVHSDPDTDPRAHVVNVCYFVMLTAEEAATAVAGDDLEELVIEPVDTANTHTLAFNHNELYIRMLEAVNTKYPETDDND